MRMVAVVLGGGTGQRIGASLPKQLLKLGGRTLLEHCVAAFEQAPGVDEILVVMASGYVDQVRAMLSDGGYRKVTGVIAGGVARPDSTRVALAAISGGDPADCGVLLHDAARPLVDQRIIAGWRRRASGAEQMSDYLLSGAISNAVNFPSITAEEAPRLSRSSSSPKSSGSFAGQLTETGYRQGADHL